jgi:hypothetical protein
MKLDADKAMDFSFKFDELLEYLRSVRGIHIPGSATTIDKQAVQTRFGQTQLFELELWLIMTKGPVLISTPILGFGKGQRPVKQFHYEEALENYPEWEELKWVPIASDGCGNYYVFPLTHDYGEYRPVLKILVSESTTEPAYVAASNLLLFLKRLIEAELGGDDDPFSVKNVRKYDSDALLIFQCDGEIPSVRKLQ